MKSSESYDPRYRYRPIDSQQDMRASSWQVYLPSDYDLAYSLFGKSPEVTAEVHRSTKLQNSSIYGKKVQTGVDMFSWERGDETEFYCQVFPHWKTLDISALQSYLGTMDSESFITDIIKSNPRLIFFSRNDGDLRKGYATLVDTPDGQDLLSFEAKDRLNTNRSLVSMNVNKHEGRHEFGMDVALATTLYETEKAVWLLRVVLKIDVETPSMKSRVEKVAQNAKDINNTDPIQIFDMFRPYIDTANYIHITKHTDKLLDV